jgi:hypothetical protein
MSIMQRAIDAEYGTFEEEVEAVWFSPDAASVRTLLPYPVVYPSEAGGGIMYDWVVEAEEEE